MGVSMATDDLPFLPTSGLHVLYDALDETGGQCARFYGGISQRCANDAAYQTSLDCDPAALCEGCAAEFADCACDGEHLEREVHTRDVCTDDVDDLRDDGTGEPDREDRSFEDFFSHA